MDKKKVQQDIFYVPDLDASIDALNHMMDTGSNAECLTEVKKAPTVYEYYGNVYRFGNIIDRDVHLYTTATSKQQAANFIKFKLKDQMNLPEKALIEIDEEQVTELPSVPKEEKEEPHDEDKIPRSNPDYDFDEHDEEGVYNSIT